MNIEAAMKLKASRDLLRAAKDAETHRCEIAVVRTLWARYHEAVEREQWAELQAERAKKESEKCDNQ